MRPGNVHSAESWRAALGPVVARYRRRGLLLRFRGDAAFAKSELYELLEAEEIGYAIRLPANASCRSGSLTCRYHLTAQRMTSAGKRKPRKTRAAVMSGALG